MINYPSITGQVILHEVNGNQKCLIFSVYGDGGRNDEELSRHQLVMDAQEKVFTKFNLPINRFYHNFNQSGMGPKITDIVRYFSNYVDYFIILDIDICPLKASFVEEIIDKIKDGKTLFGGAQQSNHIVVNNSKQHMYASLSFMGISSELYRRLGEISFNYNERGDVAEELTWKVEELGYNLCLSFPSSFCELSDEEMLVSGMPKHWDLGNGLKFGLGTTYGDMVFHATMQSLPRSTDIFIQKCQEILNNK